VSRIAGNGKMSFRRPKLSTAKGSLVPEEEEKWSFRNTVEFL
jgi:hypothetical protein